MKQPRNNSNDAATESKVHRLKQDPLLLRMQIHELEKEIEAHTAQAIRLSNELSSASQELSAIKGSPGFGLADRLNRSRVARGLLLALQKLKREGPGGVLRAAKRRLSRNPQPTPEAKPIDEVSSIELDDGP